MIGPNSYNALSNKNYDRLPTKTNTKSADLCCKLINFKDNPYCGLVSISAIFLSAIVFTAIEKNTTRKTHSVFYGLSVVTWLVFSLVIVIALAQTKCLTSYCCDSVESLSSTKQADV